MISVRRPSPEVIDRYVRKVSSMSPTHLPGDAADAMTVEHHAVACGSGEDVWDRGREAVSSWVAQRGSGMSVTPSGPPVVGATVVVATRQAGLWVLAPCRVIEVFDEPRRAGFTYATLPGHPERGVETFSVNRDDSGAVTFDIDVVFEPATLLARLSGPIGHWLQRRGTRRYLDAVTAHCRS